MPSQPTKKTPPQHVEPMAILNGSLFLIAIDAEGGTVAPVQLQTETSISIEQEELEVTDKDSQGFHKVIAGKKSGSLSFSAFVDTTTASGKKGIEDLLARFNVATVPGAGTFQRGTLIDWKFETGSSTGDLAFAGSGLLTSLEISAGTEETATVSGSVTMSGPYTALVVA